MLTSGASAGLHYLLSSLVDHDGFVFIDELAFMLTFGILKQFTGMQVIPVKMNDDGVDLADLEQKIQRANYLPKTQASSSGDVCKGVINIARKYDLGVICDDVYNLLHYGDEIPKRLYAYDSMEDSDYKGNVISNASLSKPISPGMRIGWYEVPPRVKSVLSSKGMLVSSGGFCNFTMSVLASMFEMGIAQSHIKLVRETLAERMRVTVKIL
uniref:Aminotransferase class I/classII large domain-containing protein n=1 Tax=Megaselia scalaris TaxID=36166 RepID=T1GE71_MEGSC